MDGYLHVHWVLTWAQNIAFWKVVREAQTPSRKREKHCESMARLLGLLPWLPKTLP